MTWLKGYSKKWNKKNPEKIRVYRKRWAMKHQKKINRKAREWAKAHPEIMRDRYIRYRYKLTTKQYNAMLEAQNNRCAICGKTPQENGKRLTIDHCHKTKKVRGLLCYRCNTGLASFKDELSLVSNAAMYLQLSQAEAK